MTDAGLITGMFLLIGSILLFALCNLLLHSCRARLASNARLAHTT